MSRCFPFPPPGYELKARPDDVNSIIKDKHKHKKHKHKKENDKKEGSEIKEKERSEDKHKEDKKRKRKEEKEKEKEKEKKDKEDKNKSKQSSLEVLLENQNGRKLVPDVEVGKVEANSNDMLAINDKRENNRMANGQSLSFQELDKVEKKEGNIVGYGDGSTNKDKERKEEKRRRKEEKKKRKEEKKKKKKKENNDHAGKLPKLKEFNDSLDAKENEVRANYMLRPAIMPKRVGQAEGDFRPSQNTVNLAVRERAKGQKVNPKLSSPQSVIDGVRNIRPCQTSNNRKIENDRVSSGVISPHIICIERMVEPYQTSNGVAMIKQVVNHSANGKIQSSHPFAENEQKTTGMQSMQAPDGFHKVVNDKELRLNDSLVGKKPSSSSCLKGKEKVATTTKPAHPDLEYLRLIYSVPEVECPQCDDQEWLFESQLKRPRSASSEIQWTKVVWSEAVELESADVTALPYVIPY